MKYSIADLIVEMEPIGDMLRSRIKKYEYHGEKAADIEFSVSQEFYEKRAEEHKQFTFDECEYLWSGTFFYEQISRFEGVMLHSSAVEYEGKAYLFSAPSGTGKSTHTHLWLKFLPGARIINDDKPAIRFVDGVPYAYGTPWSGKTDESLNEGFPVAGICFLNRGEENSIERISGIKALKLFMDQTVRPGKKEIMSNCLDVINKILSQIPVYKMHCNISEDAVKTSYNAMRYGKN